MFKCENCGKTWGTGQGTCDWYFKYDTEIDPSTNKLSEVNIQIGVKTYLQECKRCNAQGDIIEKKSDLKWPAESFANIIGMRIKIRPQKEKPEKLQLKESNDYHQSDLCKACKIGECVYTGKGSSGSAMAPRTRYVGGRRRY